MRRELNEQNLSLTIAKVALEKIGFITDRLPVAMLEVVQGDNLIAGGDESFRDDAADVSRRAGYEYSA